MTSYFLSPYDDIKYPISSRIEARSQTVIHGAWPQDFSRYVTTSGSTKFTFRAPTLRRACIYHPRPLRDQFYGRIWVTSAVPFGLVSEELTAEVNVWNAHFTKTVDITALDDPLDAGLQIETPTLPTTLNTNQDISYTVTISMAGPAEQDTTYEWTVDGILFDTLVTGTRLILFEFDVDWSRPERIIYEYFTTIYRAPTSHEQRRSLISDVTRNSSLKLTLGGLDAARYVNLLRYGRGRYFLVPIFSEYFNTSGTLTGATTINSAIDLTYLWNLQNYCDNIILVDYGNRLIEAKEIETISGNSVVVTKAIANSFDPDTTCIFPAFICMVSNFAYKNLNSKFIESDISFNEVRPNAL